MQPSLADPMSPIIMDINAIMGSGMGGRLLPGGKLIVEGGAWILWILFVWRLDTSRLRSPICQFVVQKFKWSTSVPVPVFWKASASASLRLRLCVCVSLEVAVKIPPHYHHDGRLSDGRPHRRRCETTAFLVYTSTDVLILRQGSCSCLCRNAFRNDRTSTISTSQVFLSDALLHDKRRTTQSCHHDRPRYP